MYCISKAHHLALSIRWHSVNISWLKWARNPNKSKGKVKFLWRKICGKMPGKNNSRPERNGNEAPAKGMMSSIGLSAVNQKSEVWSTESAQVPCRKSHGFTNILVIDQCIRSDTPSKTIFLWRLNSPNWASYFPISTPCLPYNTHQSLFSSVALVSVDAKSNLPAKGSL